MSPLTNHARAAGLILILSSTSRVLAAPGEPPPAVPGVALSHHHSSAPPLLPGLPTSDPNGDPVALPTEGEDRIDATFGRGVRFLSAERDFQLQFRGRLQPRFLTELAASGDRSVSEFVIRRARLAFLGRFQDSWELYLQLGFSHEDNEPDYYNPIRDATLTYGVLRDAMIRVGQGKVPFDRQRTNSSSALQFADRSIVMTELTLDRDVGVQVFSENLGGWGGILGYNVGLFSGDGRNRLATNSGLLVALRIWTSPFGEFDANVESDLSRGRTLRLAWGFAAAKNFDTVRPKSTTGETYEASSFDYTHLTTDLHLKWRGFSWLSEALYRRADTDSETHLVDGAPLTELSRSAWGFFTQAGYLWTEHFETAARYGELFPIGQTDPALLHERELGSAINYYLSGHNLKITVDYFFVTRGDDWDGTHQARVQTQLYF